MLIAACSFIAGALINMDVWLAGNAAPARTNTESSETKITSPSPFHRTPAGRRKTPHPSAAFASDGHITVEVSLVFSIARLLYLLWVGSSTQQSSAPVSCCKAGSDHSSKATLIILSLDHMLSWQISSSSRLGEPTTKTRDATQRHSSEDASEAAPNSARRRSAASLSNDSTTVGI